MLSGVLKGKIDDKISNITNEKKSENNKSLISENSKEKNNDKEDEEEIDMGDISKINHLLGDESKNDEDILNEIDNKTNQENKNKEEENNPEINLNINEIVNNKEENKDANENMIKVDDIKDDDSLNISKDNKEKEKKDDKDDKVLEIKKKKIDSSYISKFSQVKKAKEEGFYDNDSNIFKDNDSSHMSKDIYDLISENSNKANPPKNENKISLNNNSRKENDIIESIPKRTSLISDIQGSKVYIKSSNEQIKKNTDDLEEIKEEKDDKDNKNVNVNTILNNNEEIMPLSDFSETHKNFSSIYLADLKKHHIIYFSFCHSKDDLNNFYLKLSLFSISIILYFSLNTLFMINSKMANAYFDIGSSSPIYILINLVVPYIICGIIILLLKRYILNNRYITKTIKTIQGDKELRRIVGIDKVQEQVSKYKDQLPNQKRKRIIKNARNKAVDTLDVKVKDEYENQKDIIQSKLLPLYPKYKRIVAIYFIVGFIFLGANWYMMTSFCAIYKNTGIKLIVNSFVSLLASFIFPCIIGLIPSLIGFLSVKLNNRYLFGLYKTINKVI